MINNKSKTYTSIVWSSIQRFGTMIISFLSNLVLARLLSPDDFGTIGMLMFFIAIASTFVDSGLGSALIQKKNPTNEDYSTVFYSNLLLSLFFYLLLFFFAPLIANFYGIPILCTILRIEGVVLLLNAFCVVQTCMLRKKLDFKRLSIANIVGNIVGTIVGILFAYYGFGVWSLVIRMLVVSFVTVILLWSVGNWKPSFIFSLKSFKELFGFGGFMLLSTLTSTISQNIQTLIIGRLFSPGILGYYTQAKQLRDISTNSISGIIGQVIFPIFSNIQDDKELLKNKLRESVLLLAFINSGLMLLLILIAKELIVILYTIKWVDSVYYFQVLCIGGYFISLQDINYYVIVSTGRSKSLLYYNLAQTIFSIVLMIFGGLIYGIRGIVYAMVVSSIIYYVLLSYLSYKSCGYSVIKQLRSILYMFTIAIISGIITSAIVIGIMSVVVIVNNICLLICKSILFIAMYILISRLLKIEQLKKCINIISNKN